LKLTEVAQVLIEAHVENERGRHTATLTTNGASHALAIQPRDSGLGSKANGGELLCLALATCYCNDIYREAEKLKIEVVRVEVGAFAEFGEAGAPASRLFYRAAVTARAPEEQIRALILWTDRVAEIQNTLRKGTPVLLESFVATSVDQP
jgi:organic hydroperoxide reductase OsmC/OhrA